MIQLETDGITRLLVQSNATDGALDLIVRLQADYLA